MKKIILFFAIVFCSGPSFAEFESEDAEALAEELRHYINVTISKIIELESNQNPNAKEIDFSLEQINEEKHELGLVLNKGQRVIAVTPGSLSDKLGIVSGDILKKLAIDGVEVNHRAKFTMKTGASIDAKIIRNGNSLRLKDTISGSDFDWQLKVDSYVLTETNDENIGKDCGRLSVFFKPPEAKNYYPVMFKQLNSKAISLGRTNLKVPPGKHTIKLHELINSHGFRIRRPFYAKGKDIDINVEPNKTYYLAAEFDSSKRMKSKGEEYWKPIVWKVTERECEL